MLPALDARGALHVHGRDAFVDARRSRSTIICFECEGVAVQGSVVSVPEASAPVSEVGADDEDGTGIGEVRCKELTVLLFGGGGGVADEYGDDGCGTAVVREGAGN